MTYAKIYDHFLEKVRKEVSVYHRPLSGSMDGFYDVEYDHIVINSHLKNTRHGLRALAHEYIHFKDRHAKKFMGFFSAQKRKYTEERMKEVIDAEQSAGVGAAEICGEYGKYYNPEETNPKELPKLIKFWREFYFYK